jgi:hypothetical protein
VNISNLFEIVKEAVQDSVTDVSDVAGDPESCQPSVSNEDKFEEKSFGLGDMLHETVADAKVVVLVSFGLVLVAVQEQSGGVCSCWCFFVGGGGVVVALICLC